VSLSSASDAELQADRRTVASRSAASTQRLAAGLAGIACSGDLIALIGELGAGKTQFAKGFAAGLGIDATVNSPSFVLMAEYAGRLPLYHVDLYRLAGAEEALGGGLLDGRQADGVTLVEWADRFGLALPARRLDVRIEGSGDDSRMITFVALDPAYRRYLAALP